MPTITLPSRGQISAALRSAQLFAGLDERQIAKLAQHAVARRAETDELIFFEGDDCQGLYVIYSGAVKIFKQSAQGREQVLTIEPVGSVVAELPVFDGGPYPASCKSIESSVLLFISKDNFRRSCREDPELALKVLASVGARLRRLVTIIEELSFLTVRSRLAAMLLEVARAEKAARPAAPLRVTLKLTQQEIANRIGTVRELVSRNLGRLQAEGIVRLDGHDLIIQDFERLEQEAMAEQ
ncbi:MAG: Crp/Fnr family transcriptional regulator [Acidobacteria bacterium]|nr:Crp/Fnr family transcriptional regulator [Acidobacteriota bacterium]